METSEEQLRAWIKDKITKPMVMESADGTIQVRSVYNLDGIVEVVLNWHQRELKKALTAQLDELYEELGKGSYSEKPKLIQKKIEQMRAELGGE